MRKIIFFLMAFLVLSSSLSVSYAVAVVPASSAPAPGSSEPDPAVVKAAVDELRSLSKKEKKARFKEIKKELKAYNKAKKAKRETDTNTILLVILALLLPPLAVYLHQGEINEKFWIALVLSLLVFLSFYLWAVAVIYALLVVLNAL